VANIGKAPAAAASKHTGIQHANGGTQTPEHLQAHREPLAGARPRRESERIVE
jgi:hypothetical protein